ncbi:Uncharacterized protein OS=Pirellula staleyi (strain ATCC 27377 / DSM 6068 / ICPB 4128) GN=Psta_4565 PE=4 SV=1 [Gemmataceae bacterium]|nr:Uncharacterized protein OS=Pirellula staleyi (strain ATCC 27377 / DSM 6068 / ICPB 4128) GN=Psta_4565 PE=4 SV=1 [Gemmataceae bacterium]VTU00747.1 Uncharacterized protein OS=Pirellula staleyi (strain ATCC 27377 / DSM 6068 / ICPB 4128) GN=Psta_4565 PE=4 SV=1 [Gemmataceae bacterium]
MSVATLPTPAASRLRTPGLAFAAGFVALAVGAAALSGALPVPVAIATVFLFAGPHNWFEARYALGRLPARAGKLRGFFLVSLTGVVGLTATYAAIPWLTESYTTPAEVGTVYAVWNTAFVFWVATLVWMRSRTNPRFDAGWVWPTACLACAGVWLSPIALNVALVYVHPLMALWLLDRELTRSRPAWRPLYRAAAACVPVLLGLLWWHLSDAPDLPGRDQLTGINTVAIVQHSGAWFLDGVSAHFLVAAHTFLEFVHYGVWVVLIPLVGMRGLPWELHTIPAARRSDSWRRGVSLVLLFGLGIVLVLWVCFGLDYDTTRRVYFSFAMLHVLAEVPFLLRMV